MSLHGSDDEEITPKWKARLRDSMSPPTRDKRRLLLQLSTVTLVIIVLGLFPTKIEALGIMFESKDRTQMIILLGAVNMYALFGFILYAWSDLHLLARKNAATMSGYINEFSSGKPKLFESLNFFLRFVFDFALPLGYGLFAMYLLYGVLKAGA